MPLFLCLRLHGITSGECPHLGDWTQGEALWDEPPADIVSDPPQKTLPQECSQECMTSVSVTPAVKWGIGRRSMDSIVGREGHHSVLSVVVMNSMTRSKLGRKGIFGLHFQGCS